MSWFRKNKGGSASPKVNKSRTIVVRQYGITKTVVVRTKRNGGIKVKSINVKFA